jgi:hypothetical protein
MQCELQAQKPYKTSSRDATEIQVIIGTTPIHRLSSMAGKHCIFPLHAKKKTNMKQKLCRHILKTDKFRSAVDQAIILTIINITI